MPPTPRTRHAAALATLLLAACAHGPSARELKTAEIHHDLGLEAMQKGAAPDALREYERAV
jgi:hypothetical protein